jgi:hypothetical protein
MKIPIELFLDWQQKNMLTYSGTNVSFEFYKRMIKKSKICEYCANKFIPKSSAMYDIKKYCSMDCREKEYYRRAKVKRELKKFFNNENT